MLEIAAEFAKENISIKNRMNNNTKISILVSSCLLGEPVRYNGTAISVDGDRMRWLQLQCDIVSVCPEMLAGLGVPRLPVEIAGGDGGDVLAGFASVVGSTGMDCTQSFIEGAGKALKICKKFNVEIAILTENSPSCGSNNIYDGTFQGIRIAGSGVTATYLRNHGISVFNQNQLDLVFDYLCEKRGMKKN